MPAIKSVYSSWNQFWFESDNPLALALVRISLGLSMILTYIGRFWEMEYFSDSSVISKTFVQEMIEPTLNIPFFLIFKLGIDPIFFQVAFMALLVFFTLGLLNRWGVFILWFFHLAFLYRNVAIIFGADFVSATFLFYMVFANSQRALSLRQPSLKISPDMFSSISVRMMQIQMSLIYAFTGFEKFKGGTWWDGTALWNVFMNSQFTIADLTWFRHFPLVIVFLGISTLIFEVYFPVMVFSKKFKIPWLLMGVFFHLGITLFLGLFTFSFVMLSIYWIFLKEEEIRDLFKKFVLK